MPVTYNDYINAVKSYVREPIIKLEFLDANENVISSITPSLYDGSLSLDYGTGIGSRRSASLFLENTTGAYIPNVDGLWVQSKFRVWTGLRINGEDYFISRGIFCLSQPDVSSFMSDKNISLSLLDKWTMINGELAGELANDYIITVGTRIDTAVRGIFTEAGETKNPVVYPTDIVTPYTITEEAGSSYASILTKLAEMLSWECFYDKNGVPRFQPPTDRNKSASLWNFTTDEVNYRGSTHRYEFSKIKNSVKVIGDNILGEIFDGLAEDTNATSPTRINLIGRRTKVIIDNLIYSDVLCQGRAEYELERLIAEYESADINSIPIDIIEEGKIITIGDDANGLVDTDRFLVQSINFPFRNGDDMSLGVWKVRSLS
jgi:hypothetical protein